MCRARLALARPAPPALHTAAIPTRHPASVHATQPLALMCPQGGNTALHLAAEQGHEDAVRLLADQEDGAFINFANRVPALLHCCAPRLPC